MKDRAINPHEESVTVIYVEFTVHVIARAPKAVSQTPDSTIVRLAY